MNSKFVRFGPSNATHRLVLLHGWGADAEDLVPLGQLLIENQGQTFELVALRAPHQHPQGCGRQWYGLFPPQWSEVPYAIKDLQIRLNALATNAIPLEKTVLLGFSQGGAMALASGCDFPFAGLICCSSYPHPNWIPTKSMPPVFLTHGINDDVVPYAACQHIISALEKMKINAELFNFEGGHEIPPEAIPGIQRILKLWCI